ncbi:MAG TPA: hypothetical protein PK916_08955 [Bacteroidota bacterium]|nr:hypothetical protein [Bacteroidota bacterium]
MKNSTLIVIALIVALIVAVGWFSYQYGRKSVVIPPHPTPAVVVETVELPGQIVKVPYAVPGDSSALAERRAKLDAWEMELRRVADSIGVYGALYVEADTTLPREITIETVDEDGNVRPLQTQIVFDKLKLRYGVPPIDYLALVAGSLNVRVPQAVLSNNEEISSSTSTWGDLWDAYRTFSTWTVALAILAGILYIVI